MQRIITIFLDFYLQKSKKKLTFASDFLSTGPDVGIGRQVGLKHRCWKACGFDPRSGYFKENNRNNIAFLLVRRLLLSGFFFASCAPSCVLSRVLSRVLRPGRRIPMLSSSHVLRPGRRIPRSGVSKVPFFLYCGSNPCFLLIFFVICEKKSIFAL